MFNIGQVFSPGFLSAWQDEKRRRDSASQYSGTSKRTVTKWDGDGGNEKELLKMRLENEKADRESRERMSLLGMDFDRESLGVNSAAKKRGMDLDEQQLGFAKEQATAKNKIDTDALALKSRELEEVKLANVNERNRHNLVTEDQGKTRLEQDAFKQRQLTDYRLQRMTDMNKQNAIKNSIDMGRLQIDAARNADETKRAILRVGADLARNPLTGRVDDPELMGVMSEFSTEIIRAAARNGVSEKEVAALMQQASAEGANAAMQKNGGASGQDAPTTVTPGNKGGSPFDRWAELLKSLNTPPSSPPAAR